jgi:hypothetical protein
VTIAVGDGSRSEGGTLDEYFDARKWLLVERYLATERSVSSIERGPV